MIPIHRLLINRSLVSPLPTFIRGCSFLIGADGLMEPVVTKQNGLVPFQTPGAVLFHTKLTTNHRANQLSCAFTFLFLYLSGSYLVCILKIIYE